VQLLLYYAIKITDRYILGSQYRTLRLVFMDNGYIYCLVIMNYSQYVH